MVSGLPRYQKIEVLEYDELASLVDYEAIDRFRKTPLARKPCNQGYSPKSDVFFQAREASIFLQCST